eukprot:2251465-Pleurochrysis_carterae.AAC.1
MDGVECGGSNHNLYLFLKSILEINPDNQAVRKTKNFVYSCREYMSSYEDLLEVFPEAIDCRDIFDQTTEWFEMSDSVFRPKVIKISFKDSYKMISSPLRDFAKMFKLENVQKEVMPYDLYTREFVYGEMEGICDWEYILKNCGLHFIDYDELKANLHKWSEDCVIVSEDDK